MWRVWSSHRDPFIGSAAGRMETAISVIVSVTSVLGMAKHGPVVNSDAQR